MPLLTLLPLLACTTTKTACTVHWALATVYNGQWPKLLILQFHDTQIWKAGNLGFQIVTWVTRNCKSKQPKSNPIYCHARPTTETVRTHWTALHWALGMGSAQIIGTQVARPKLTSYSISLSYLPVVELVWKTRVDICFPRPVFTFIEKELNVCLLAALLSWNLHQELQEDNWSWLFGKTVEGPEWGGDFLSFSWNIA